MGLTEDYRLGWDVPSEVDGHRIWYTGAVGTEDLLADVLLERAADAGADIGDAREAVRELAASVAGTEADSGPEPNAGAGAGIRRVTVATDDLEALLDRASSGVALTASESTRRTTGTTSRRARTGGWASTRPR